MANPFGRFHSELACCREKTSTCGTCGYPISHDSDEMIFFWDGAYGACDRSLEAKHTVFWCELSMVATRESAHVLGSLDLSFVTLGAISIPAKEAYDRYKVEAEDLDLPVTWVRPRCGINLVMNDPQVCIECGKILGAAWKLNGLKVRRCDAERLGVFTIKQNRGNVSFATEEAKEKIEATNIRGIAFYKAGRLVD